MRTKLIFCNDSKEMEFHCDLSFIPRLNEWLNVKEFLKTDEINAIAETANCWSGTRGTVQSVEYRNDEKDYYVEIYVWCED